MRTIRWKEETTNGKGVDKNAQKETKHSSRVPNHTVSARTEKQGEGQKNKEGLENLGQGNTSKGFIRIHPMKGLFLLTVVKGKLRGKP